MFEGPQLGDGEDFCEGDGRWDQVLGEQDLLEQERRRDEVVKVASGSFENLRHI